MPSNVLARSLLVGSALVAVGGYAPLAFAQDNGLRLEEVIVTASKRAENLQELSTTVTAFSSSYLESRGLDDFEDYAQFVPGFDYQKQGVAQSQYVMRGATVSRVVPAEPQNRSLVGLYMNDVPMDMNGLNPDLDLFDTRVEVLKGPQGSLFGDSAMAGAVRYITNPADPSAMGGSVLASLSSIEGGGTSYNVKGMINVPLVEDELAIRAVAIYRDNAGWADNVNLGTTNTNTEQTESFRLSLRGTPNEDFTYDLMLFYQDTSAGTPPYDTDAPGTDGIGGRAEFSRETDETIDDKVVSFIGTLNHNFDWGSVTSVTSYQERDIDNVLVELTEAYKSYFGDIDGGVLLHTWDMKRFTQEVRVATDLDGMFNATFGVYYSNQEINFGNDIIYPGLDALIAGGLNPFGLLDPPNITKDDYGCAGLVDQAYCGPENNKVNQKAFFGEVYVDLTEELRLTVGGRYYDYSQDYFQDFGGLLNFGRFTDQVKTSNSGFNPKFGLSYDVNEDVLVYANVAKGFRLGGVSNVLPSFCDADLASLGLTRDDVATFDPDKLWSYEGGVKSTNLDGRLTLNGAVYYTKWSGIQTGVNLACGYIPTTNAGALEAKGLELESQFAVTEELTVFASMAINDSQLVGDAPAVGGFDGDRAPFAPKFKGVFGFDYTTPVSDSVVLSTNLTAKYSSKAVDSFAQTNILFSQFVANARISAKVNDAYRITAFVDNLTDEYIATAARTRFGLSSYYVGRPRTFGLEFAADF